jgi:hypothetical protein
MTHMAECWTCGHSETRPIAPLYVECQGFTEQRVIAGQTQIGVQLNGAPVIAPVYRTERIACRQRRHEVAMALMMSETWPSCACGTFAIGFCAGCRQPVCGDDSTRAGKLRVCLACNRPNILRDIALSVELTQLESEERRTEALNELQASVAHLKPQPGEEPNVQRGSRDHAQEVQANEEQVGPFDQYMVQMRSVRGINLAEFRRMRDYLGCGNHDCPEPFCVGLRHQLGILS